MHMCVNMCMCIYIYTHTLDETEDPLVKMLGGRRWQTEPHLAMNEHDEYYVVHKATNNPNDNVCLYIYICIYVYRERERGRDLCVHLSIYLSDYQALPAA